MDFRNGRIAPEWSNGFPSTVGQDGGYRLLDANGEPMHLSGEQPDGPLIPHVYTFSAVFNAFSKMYMTRFDEAQQYNPQDALAMRNDTYFSALLQERYLATATRDWHLEPEDPDDGDAADFAPFAERLIRRTPRWTDFVRNLCEADWYGKHGAQVEYGKDELDGAQQIKFWTPVNGDKIEWEWGAKVPSILLNATAQNNYPKEFIRPRTSTLHSSWREDWRRQFIIHRFYAMDADFFDGQSGAKAGGTGLRDLCFWAWWLRDELLSWALDFMKKVGTLGLMIFWYEELNKTAKLQAEKNAREASNKTALVMPRTPGQQMPANDVQHFPAQTLRHRSAATDDCRLLRSPH